MRPCRALLLLITALHLLLAAAAPAEAKRVALVIGNGAYRNLAALPNPPNDARAMAATLRRLGFEVDEAIDLDRGTMDRRLRAFVRSVDNSEVAAFFYAGHGLQVDGRNYLAPVDAELMSAPELPFETFDLETVVGALERGTRIGLVFVDACRDNPLAQRLQAGARGRSVSVGRGLAPVETGTGMLIAYATQPGNVAVDGEGANSPFTAALAKSLEVPGLEVRQVMTRVRQTVIAATGGAQVPWDHSSLTEDVYLLPREREPAPPPQATEPPPGFDPRQADLAFWDAIKDSREPRVIEEYL
ncbi:MAG TPA: caspase domain-containing protein, partial [Geminicoccaceae bacterium]|nr:caspase domain-containing protein [Geminicoccaceae bacterium]